MVGERVLHVSEKNECGNGSVRRGRKHSNTQRPMGLFILFLLHPLFLPSPHFSLRRGFQKNMMYRAALAYSDVMFGFVFPAKFPAYKLLPPLCLVSTPIVLFRTSYNHCPLFGQTTYSFLSLINFYELLRGKYYNLEGLFL